MNFFNYIILEIFLKHEEVEEYDQMLESLKMYFEDFIQGRRNEKVDSYVSYAIRLFDQNLTNKHIYKADMDDELYELIEVAKLIV